MGESGACAVVVVTVGGSGKWSIVVAVGRADAEWEEVRVRPTPGVVDGRDWPPTHAHTHAHAHNQLSHTHTHAQTHTQGRAYHAPHALSVALVLLQLVLQLSVLEPFGAHHALHRVQQRRALRARGGAPKPQVVERERHVRRQRTERVRAMTRTG